MPSRIGLVIVAKQPVSQHIQFGMVVGVMTIVQVVVLAGCAQALCIGDAQGFGWLNAQKIVLKLSHPGVVEHQGRIVFGNNTAHSQR